MKISIISDTHFGDENCTLVALQNGTVVNGPKYDKFKDAVGQGNDYLVLAGDILDFSVASYEEAYRSAQFFFKRIQEDNISKEIIYLAGNHDADIWHIIQHQRAVINRLQNTKLPEKKHITTLCCRLLIRGRFVLMGAGLSAGACLSHKSQRRRPLQRLPRILGARAAASTECLSYANRESALARPHAIGNPDPDSEWSSTGRCNTC